MNPELDKKLVEDFPILYRDRYGDLKDTAMVWTSMIWGFEVGDGWEPIIRRLSEKIEEYNKKHEDNPVIAVQVKEKFGSLRFYVSHYPDEIDGLVDAAEAESERVCEICGKEGKLRPDLGWMLTLCDDCYHNRKRNRG
jgi:hypothetical protein